MEVIYETPGDDNDLGKTICMVQMSPDEAMLTIRSLLAQLVEHNANAGRYEATAKDGTYFSIGVHDQEAIDLHTAICNLRDKVDGRLNAARKKTTSAPDVVNSLVDTSLMVYDIERYARAMKVLK